MHESAAERELSSSTGQLVRVRRERSTPQARCSLARLDADVTLSRSRLLSVSVSAAATQRFVIVRTRWLRCDAMRVHLPVAVAGNVGPRIGRYRRAGTRGQDGAGIRGSGTLV